MNRTKGVLILVGVMTLAAVGGWVAASQIESPAEAAARTEAPEPSPILVPVELQELSTDVITRGTGRFGSPQPIAIPSSPLKGDTPQVLTGAADPGEELDQGVAGLGISGRPVFIFEGQIPSYRDLGPGMRGADIEQLEAGLAATGFDPGPVDGVFDSATELAVAALYSSAGFEAVSVSAAQLAELNTVATGLIPGSQSTTGVHVPADELLIVSAAPVRIAELLIPVGGVIDGPVGTVTDANIAIDSSVPIESAGLITEGMEVLIDEPDLGIEATGTVSRVAESPGTDGVDGFHVYFEVEVDGDPTNVVNASVRLTIPIESTGEPVLVVPISAVTLGADGSSRVQRQVGESLEPVVVEPGLSAQGLVEVVPVDGELDVGDLVVVGFE
jgi:peptidoglycan hydrolase-like protein with peptidoglycan-binding domain